MDNHIIEIKKLRFSYGHNLVLKDISLNFETGKFYGILGPNGCGKTTLFDLLIKYKKPDSGTINVNGTNIAKYSREEISKLISIVPQDFYIKFPFKVEEVIWMGRYPYIPKFAFPDNKNKEIVNNIINDLNLADLKDKFITKLSSGEKQRVVFARAIAQTTPILLIDEGTSNMDIRHSVYILNYVKNLVFKERKTVIAVFHNLNFASLYCDRLVFMKHGEIVAYGETDKVFCNEIIEETFNVNCNIYLEQHTGKKQVIWNLKNDV